MRQLQEEHYRSPIDNDERILYRMVRQYGALPPRTFQDRPIFGIHFSPNRGKGKVMGLCTTRARFLETLARYPSIASLAPVQQMAEQLEDEFEVV